MEVPCNILIGLGIDDLRYQYRYMAYVISSWICTMKIFQFDVCFRVIF